MIKGDLPKLRPNAAKSFTRSRISRSPTWTWGKRSPCRGSGPKPKFPDREAIRLKSNDNGAFLGLCDTLAHLQKWTEAEAACREAIRLNPNSAFIYFVLGSSLAEQDKLVEAIAELRESLRFNPAYLWAHLNLGEVLVSQAEAAGKTPPWDEATAEFVRAIELSQDQRNNDATIASYRAGTVG